MEIHISYSVVSSINFYKCTGSSWDGVNFLYNSIYGAVFWICIDNNVLAASKDCMHNVKFFFFFPASTPSAIRLGVGKKLQETQPDG